MTVEKLIKAYMERYSTGHYRRATGENKRKALVYFAEYLREKHGVRETTGISPVTLGEIEEFREWLRKGGTGIRKALTEKTARLYVKQTRGFLKAVSAEYGITSRAAEEMRPGKDNTGGLSAELKKYLDGFTGVKEAENCPVSSLDKIRFVLGMFCRYLMDERKKERFTDMRKEDVKEFVAYLAGMESVKGEKKYSAGSVNRYGSIVKEFLSWLSKSGICAPLSGYIRNIRQEQRLSRNILSRKEISRLFKIRAANPYEFMAKTVFAVLYGSGLRIGEVLSLKLKNIDFDKNELYIYETKTNRERAVQMGGTAAEYLRIYLDRVRKLIDRGDNDKDRVFVSYHYGAEVCRNGINKVLKRFCRKAGIQKAVSCHCFRHSYGTHLLESGAKLKQVSDLLGHEDIASTEKYVRLSPEHLRRTVIKYHPLENGRKAWDGNTEL